MNKIIIVHYQEDPEAIEAFECAVERLWAQHVDYTRNAIISILGKLDDENAVVDHLAKTQEDIANAIVPYYTEGAANELSRLLKEHSTIVVTIVRAIRDAKDTAELEAAAVKNAEAIAIFLNAADADNWPKEVVIGLLKKHLDYTLAEAKSRFAKDWYADFSAYDSAKDNAKEIAYAMACGILTKFPELFVKQFSAKTLKKN